MRVALPRTAIDTPEQVVRFYERLVERVGALPGVASAGAARSLPLGSTIGDFGLDGRRLRAAARHQREGRLADRRPTATRSDGRAGHPRPRHHATPTAADSQLVALINEEMARRYWQGRDPSAAGSGSAANPSVPGSPSSASSATCGTTVSPKWSRRSSTCRTRSGKVGRQPDPRMTLVVGPAATPCALIAPGRGSGRAASIRTCRSPTCGRWTTWSARRCRRRASPACCSRCSRRSRWRCRRSASTACSPTWSAGARARSASASPSAPARARSCGWCSGSGLTLALTGVVIGLGARCWASTLIARPAARRLAAAIR